MLFSLPTATLAILCSLFFVAISWLGLFLVRPFLRIWVRSQPGANELIGQASSGFSLFYGLVLGLLSVAAYQNSEEVKRSINLEAASLASLYRTVAFYPEPLGSELQYLLRDYTLYVIHKDWPTHREGRVQHGGLMRLQAIEQNLLTFDPATRTQEILQTQALGNFSELANQREQRLIGVRATIPGALWYVVGIGAIIHIMLLWMLDMRFFTHVLLGDLVSFFLGVMIFIIAAMGNPMRSGVTAAVTAPAFEFVSLGTGAITGLYYPTGRAICSLANHEDAGGAVRCSVEPTSGLVYNVDHLATGDLDFALIQSDVQFDAYTGRGPWAARPMPELRSVFTVFTEAVAIVARADLDVTGLDSLKGMRLSVGNPGSGARATWEKIEAALGWKREDLRLRPACARRRASMRCAMTRSTHSCCCRATLRLLWTRRAAGCLIRLFGVEGPAIDQLVAASPYYRHTVVPASAYGFGADIKTFGSAATLVTSTHVADAVVHAIAKAVLGHLDEFGALTPTMVGMTPAEMIHDSLTAPLHPGAERAYRELGLMR